MLKSLAWLCLWKRCLAIVENRNIAALQSNLVATSLRSLQLPNDLLDAEVHEASRCIGSHQFPGLDAGHTNSAPPVATAGLGSTAAGPKGYMSKVSGLNPIYVHAWFGINSHGSLAIE